MKLVATNHDPLQPDCMQIADLFIKKAYFLVQLFSKNDQSWLDNLEKPFNGKTKREEPWPNMGRMC